MDAADLTGLQLDVYMTREGPWNPEHGEIEIPDDWESLESGDAFVTRRVKAAGTYWVAWRPRGRNRPHRRRLGFWAPKEAIESAQAEAAATEDKRGRNGCTAPGPGRDRRLPTEASSRMPSAGSWRSPLSTAASPTRSPRRLLATPVRSAAAGWGAPESCRWRSGPRWRRER